MSQSFKLFRLQQIDSELAKERSRVEEIELLLADLSEEKSSQTRLDSAKKERDLASKNLRLAEQNVQAQRFKIEQSEATLYSGKIINPKELQDLQMELESLKRYLSTLEDRQLETMLEFDDKEDIYQQRTDKHELLLEKIAEEKKEWNLERERLLEEINRHESERMAATSNINQQDLRLYETLRQKKNGVAVAAVVEKTCAACGSTLTAASFSAAHSPNVITHCPTCGRILYLG
jgi:predicted  nucleic acid-binding Zn-ribbon protein